MSVHVLGRGPGHMCRAPLSLPVVYPGKALALDFKNNIYEAGGKHYLSLAAMPGYSYSRTGQVGFVDSGNNVDWFAANVVPNVPSLGFENYGAITNGVPWSQELSGLTAQNTSVTSNVSSPLAPDGTQTADQMVCSVTAAAATRYTPIGSQGASTPVTVSAFLKSSASHIGYLGFELTDPPAYCYFDLNAGTVGTRVAGSMTGVTSSIQSIGNGWYRCVMQATPGASGTGYTYVGVADADASQSATLNDSIFGWQVQAVSGAFSDGGPLLPTSGSAGGIGAQTLSVNCPNGNYTATYTFSDSTTQNIATTISGGVFTMPSSLNEFVVASVMMQ